ncbi:MAG: hypothetical protein SFX18_01340 [Pirellulales bacterium]|nr:hypothetical protein [Pirellulales bacterium]
MNPPAAADDPWPTTSLSCSLYPGKNPVIQQVSARRGSAVALTGFR